MGKFKNYDGMRFNNLTVIRRDHKEGRRWYFLCLCDCGKQFVTDACSMKTIKSCGCMTHKLISESKIKHGGAYTRLYQIWHKMKRRCYDKNDKDYEDYGGRGIKVCDEWINDFNAFREWALTKGYVEDSKARISIDRINVDGDYDPSNCRWADDYTQANNKRNNVYITYDGETHTVSEWERIKGVARGHFSYRLRSGKEVKDVFEMPSPKSRKELVREVLDVLETKEFARAEDFASIVSPQNIMRYIHDLENSGISIDRIWEKYISDDGTVKRRRVYSLRKEKADGENDKSV